MFRLDSEQALIAAFRPKDQKLLELPPDVKFPLHVPHYLSWMHPAGGRAFVVFSVPGGVPTGIAFDTNSSGAGPSVPHMCDWCHCSGMGTQVGLLTARLNGMKRVGVQLCSDLSCKEKLEDMANRSGATVQPMMEKLLERMGRFASGALKIDLSGAGR